MSEAIVVRVPQINPNDEHAVVVRWHVAKGTRVRAGQPLVTLETTKTTFDVDAPSDGFAFFEHEANAEVAVGAPVAWISDTEKPPEVSVAAAQQAKPRESAERFTRKARKLMKEHGLTEADFPGDHAVEAELVERTAAARNAKTAGGGAEPQGRSPLELAPTKITEIQVLTRVRDQTVPSTVAVAVAGDRLEQRLRREAESHGPVSALEVAIYEAARLLAEWPELNAFFADGKAWKHDLVAIGFAMNLGRSLRVPVVKDAARLSLREIAQSVRALSLRYMRGNLALDDVTGGTFTITDLSGEGVVHFIPVLNERQSAILGLCAPRNDGCRDLVLTFDHRLSDGMRAGRFLAALRARLEQADG